MPDEKPNPYESPQAASAAEVANSQQRDWGWWVIPVVVFTVLGGLSCFFGLTLAILDIVIWLQSTELTIVDSWAIRLGGAMVFIGVVWIVAAYAFEHRRYAIAIVATFVGFVPPAVWFVLA